MAQITDFNFSVGEQFTAQINLRPNTSISGWTLVNWTTKRYGGWSGLIQKYWGGSGFVASGSPLGCSGPFVNGQSGINVTDPINGVIAVSFGQPDTSGWSPGNYYNYTERVDSGYQTFLNQSTITLKP